uniref:Uncharacterized protein MANES_05G074400 n=1 Tax=Rhizophora mucronata TaxID=61149 RepID=A0A2P2IH22_RHIMU
MATPDVLQMIEEAGDAKSRGMSIEKKIEFLESLTGRVSNRRSRRWLNDRLLMELVPRLNAEEIKGLFAPPPWGNNVFKWVFPLTNLLSILSGVCFYTQMLVSILRCI